MWCPAEEGWRQPLKQLILKTLVEASRQDISIRCGDCSQRLSWGTVLNDHGRVGNCHSKRKIKHFHFTFNLASLPKQKCHMQTKLRLSVLSILFAHFIFFLFASQVPYIVSHVVTYVPKNAFVCSYTSIHTYTYIYTFNFWRGFNILIKGIIIL